MKKNLQTFIKAADLNQNFELYKQQSPTSSTLKMLYFSL